MPQVLKVSASSPTTCHHRGVLRATAVKPDLVLVFIEIHSCAETMTLSCSPWARPEGSPLPLGVGVGAESAEGRDWVKSPRHSCALSDFSCASSHFNLILSHSFFLSGCFLFKIYHSSWPCSGKQQEYTFKRPLPSGGSLFQARNSQAVSLIALCFWWLSV